MLPFISSVRLDGHYLYCPGHPSCCRCTAVFVDGRRSEIFIDIMRFRLFPKRSKSYFQQSLMSTIVNLAQDYVGSNNINLLLPIGQFGTRLQGGKDSASPRYIFTQLK